MASSHEIQYPPPDTPPPIVLNNDPENPFSDDETIVKPDTANDPTQITASDFPTVPSASPNDRFIAVMGVAGAGKSTFISRCTEQAPKIGHDLVSCTVDAEVFSFQYGDLNIHLIDTPGFDDTRIPDEEVLSNIAFWLSVSYEANVRLSGIVYLHPIHKVRMGGSAHKNLRMFKQLCGEEGLSSVVLATNMWSKVSEEVGKRREEQLKKDKDMWADMISQGSVVFRHEDTQESAMKIIDFILNRGRTTVLSLQRQMSEGMELEETDAGREYRRDLESQIQGLEKTIGEMRGAIQIAKETGDEKRRQKLQDLMESYEKKREETERKYKAKIFQIEEMLRKKEEAIEAALKSRDKMADEYKARIRALKEKMAESRKADLQRMNNQLQALSAAKLQAERDRQILADRLRLQQQARAQRNPGGAALAARVGLAAYRVAEQAFIDLCETFRERPKLGEDQRGSPGDAEKRIIDETFNLQEHNVVTERNVSVGHRDLSKPAEAKANYPQLPAEERGNNFFVEHFDLSVDENLTTRSDVSSISDDRESISSLSARTQDTGSSFTLVDNTDLMDVTAGHFAELLLADEKLKKLCCAAIESSGIGASRFATNFRRLLDNYSVNLKSEAQTEKQALAGRFVRSRSGYIANFVKRRLDNQEEDTAVFTQLRAEQKMELTAKIKLLAASGTRRTASDDRAANDQIEDETGVEAEPLDDIEAYEGPELFVELSQVQHFMLSSTAFHLLRENLHNFVFPPFGKRLGALLRKLSKSGAEEPPISGYNLRGLCNELQCVHSNAITITTNSSLGFFDYLKGVIEEFTGEEWEWWPFKRRKRALGPDEARVSWHCACGEDRWAEVPSTFARGLEHILRNIRNQTEANVDSLSPNQQLSTTNSSTENTPSPTNLAAAPQGSQSIPPNSQIPAQPTPAYNASSLGYNRGAGSGTSSGVYQGAIEGSLHWRQSPLPRPNSNQNVPDPLHVFFVVTVDRNHYLSEMRVECLTGDGFFKLLKSEYERLRGRLRRWLSIWGYSHCDFFKFVKFHAQEFIPAIVDYPADTLLEYKFNPRPIGCVPPISPHEFEARYYRCYEPRPHLHWWHKCRGVCAGREPLELFPKRLMRLQLADDEREEFWGIYARERRWFSMVILYTTLCMLPSIPFIFLWLCSWGRHDDLQNATVPLTVSISFLSLLWGYILAPSDVKLQYR